MNELDALDALEQQLTDAIDAYNVALVELILAHGRERVAVGE